MNAIQAVRFLMVARHMRRLGRQRSRRAVVSTLTGCPTVAAMLAPSQRWAGGMA
jgi:hypothetical protein